MALHDVLEFIKRHRLAVVATSYENIPEAAVVEFGELDDMTIVVDTFRGSRKYQNIRKNSRVAIVIGWDEDVTVQIDAVAVELEGQALAEATQAYFTKNPAAQKWQNRDDIVYVAFKPVKIRYTDVSRTPWLVQNFDVNL